MRVIFLASTEPDLRWFKRYYAQVFPEGRQKAVLQFLATQRIIIENPNIDVPSKNVVGVREFQIIRTPFSVIYRVRDSNIEILRIIDNRSDWNN